MQHVRSYDEAVVDGGVKRSNIVFGDRAPDVTNVIFVNGDVDPWHALGILNNVSAAATAVMVDGMCCSAILYHSSESQRINFTSRPVLCPQEARTART